MGRFGIPAQNRGDTSRILEAVWKLEGYRRSVLGEEESEAVDMLARQVAYSGIAEVLQECRFGYEREPAGTGRFGHDWYMPYIAYLHGTAKEERHQLSSTGQVLYRGPGSNELIPAGAYGRATMANRAEWLAGNVLHSSGLITIDSGIFPSDCPI